jgi:protein phosphatase
LLSDFQSGNIQQIDNLRSRLQVIANELQANSATPNLESDPAPEVVATPQQSVAPILEMDEAQDITKIDDMPTLVLLRQLTSLEDAGCTDVGRQRNHNEDFFGIETAINKLEFPNNRVIQARGVYILCDGMGGHAGGEVASNLAGENASAILSNLLAV